MRDNHEPDNSAAAAAYAAIFAAIMLSFGLGPLVGAVGW